MEASHTFLLLSCLVLAFYAQTGHGIRCWDCNSGDKFHGDACKKMSDTSLIKDCGNHTLCRKMEQTVVGEYRVIRQCATLGRTDRCVERTGTKGISLTYCQCDSDECNSAVSFTAGITTLIVAAVAVIRQYL